MTTCLWCARLCKRIKNRAFDRAVYIKTRREFCAPLMYTLNSLGAGSRTIKYGNCCKRSTAREPCGPGLGCVQRERAREGLSVYRITIIIRERFSGCGIYFLYIYTLSCALHLFPQHVRAFSLASRGLLYTMLLPPFSPQYILKRCARYSPER